MKVRQVLCHPSTNVQMESDNLASLFAGERSLASRGDFPTINAGWIRNCSNIYPS
jgi:hypothetical protein